jgi:putative membrane protein
MKTILTSILAGGLVFSLSAQDNKNKDMDFAKEAAEAGVMEVKLGQLAVSKATSQEVRTLGQHMVDDHSKANNELMALASKKTMNLPSALSSDGQKAYDELNKKSGADFDKAYSEMMVKDHKKVISKFEHEAEKGDDADLKAWASKTLPTLKHHLEMSEASCKDHKKDHK